MAPSQPDQAQANGRHAEALQADGKPNGVHATGQPDTPVEVMTALLGKALQQQDLPAMRQLVQQAYDIASGLDDYLTAVSTPASQVCQELVQESLTHDWAGAHAKGKTQFLQKKECCAGTLEGAFLRSLVKLTGAKSVLEVGMFTGSTTLAMAEVLPDDGKVYTLDLEPYLVELAAPFWQRAGVSHRIEPVLGPAAESIAALAARGVRFDLAFLDADKTGYLGYYRQLMDGNLLAPNGLIVVDNSLMKGRVYAPGGVQDELADAIREFNQVVVVDPRVEVVVLPFRDGVSLVTRKSPPADAGSVVTGAARNSLLQRLRLTGRVALVTGAGQGIGRAYAHALGEAGAAVAVVDVNKAAAQSVAEELSGKGVRSLAIAADITSSADCQRMVERVVVELGGLHIAVNNAGINKNSAAEDTPEAEWEATFAVNTKGTFLCCQAEARHMLQQKAGRIINTASMAGTSMMVPHPQKQAAYNASKAAVVKLTQSLAGEWAGRGVTVNAISPGIVRTALIEESEALRPLVQTWLGQIPAGRLAELEDLQAGLVWLASDAAAYVNGHNLVIDGGQTLW